MSVFGFVYRLFGIEFDVYIRKNKKFFFVKVTLKL